MMQQQPLSPTADGSWFLSPCIEWIFKEEHADICDRVRAAAAAGLPGVEFHMWRNKPLDDLKRAADDSGAHHHQLSGGTTLLPRDARGR